VWSLAPRGTAVLYAAPGRRARLRAPVAPGRAADGLPPVFGDVGADDLTAWLTAPRALRLLGQLGFDRLRRHNVELAVLGQRMVADALGLDAASLPRDPAVSMQLVPLPAGIATDAVSAAALRDQIGEQIACEVAVTAWDGRGFVRLSAQAYNCPADYARLAADLPSLL
jgi:isopenicillin-N epimerase